MSVQLRRLAIAFAAAFAAIALASGYWANVRRAELVGRGDNPRRLLAERRVPRGTIYDRNDTVLADSAGPPGALVRRYLFPNLAPVLGYVSQLYGSAGLEAAFDPILHGDAGIDPMELYWRGTVLGAPPAGRGVRLTIDVGLQTAADAALGSRAGAVVVLEAKTGEILAMASHPTYDANRLDDAWEGLVADASAPLLNRATLALYQPGSALWPVILAGALQAGLGDTTQAFPFAAREVEIGDQVVGCREAPSAEALTLKETLALGCPWPITTLGTRLGAAGLVSLFDKFGLYTAPEISIPTTAAASEARQLAEPKLAAIGQGELTITPLHLALAAAALARRGLRPAPQLVLATQGPTGTWQRVLPEAQPEAAIAPEFADQVKALIADGYSATALTSTEGKTLAWFSGFTPAEDTRFVTVVLLEDGDVEAAAKIGGQLLRVAEQSGN